MAFKTLLPILTLSSALHIQAATSVLEDFQFADSTGTGLKNTANAGTAGTAWNFNLGGEPGQAATHNGLLSVGFNTNAGSSAVTTDYTRKLTFATALTSGQYTFEYRLNDWDLQATASANSAASNQQGFTLKLKGTGEINLVTAITSNNGNMRARHSGSAGATATADQSNIGLNASDLVVRVEGNLDTGTFYTSYNLGGTGFNTVISDGAGVTQIDEILLNVEGSSAWSTNDYINIDYLTLTTTAVPEPSTTSLLGLGGLALILRRRK
ncbi:PEP-CTERM sorting domain-containing protein [Rubritalea tangerina]|uniref:PEP-CTERM sorting domain-containing protein n=1 Tax=Rubritalea tangerina TaxID=430798 RepID=A0ABW4ZDF1_9BACT